MLTINYHIAGILKDSVYPDTTDLTITESNEISEHNLNAAFEQLYKHPENNLIIDKPPLLITVFYKDQEDFLYDKTSIEIKTKTGVKLTSGARKQTLPIIKKYILK